MISMLLVALVGAAYAAGFLHGRNCENWAYNPEEEAPE